MIAYFILLGLILYLISFLYFSTKKPNNFPPGPKWFPIVGSFPQFKNLMKFKNDLATTFDTLSKQYKSDIIGLKLGSENIVVVLSSKLAKNVFLDDNYLAKPDIFFNRVRAMGTLQGVTLSGGKSWAAQRKFVVMNLLKRGYGKKAMETKLTNEIQEVIKMIDLNPVDVDFGTLFGASILNVLWTLVDGTEISRDDLRVKKLLDLIHKRTLAFDISGSTLNYFPWLRFLAPEKFGYNLLKEVNVELGKFLNDAIENHLHTWVEGRNDDLIYAYISEIKRSNENVTNFSFEQLQISCRDLFFGGATTTSAAIDFLFFAMAIHQDVQAKVHNNLDETFDRSKPFEYSDRKKVPYVEAVICEVERCYTVLPVIAPRAAIENAILDGYKIPKGTSVFVSFDSMFKNPEYFDKPETFQPERFLDSNGGLILHEQFFPFGLGKRKCLGDVLAKMSIFLIFAEIMSSYKIYPLDASLNKEDYFIPGIFRSKQIYPIKLVKRF